MREPNIWFFYYSGSFYFWRETFFFTNETIWWLTASFHNTSVLHGETQKLVFVTENQMVDIS